MTGFTDGFVVSADGLKIHFRAYAAMGPVTGVPVLCLHGLTRNVRDFEELAPKIAGLGRRVIVASQRGRGLSDWDPDTARYNPAVYVGDMLRLLDHLDIPRAIFVGTSMGGLMTMITATMAPQRIAAAILNDIGPELDPAGLSRIQSYAGKAGPVADWAAAMAQNKSINGVAFPDEAGDEFWMNFTRKLFREDSNGVPVFDYDPGISASVKPGAAQVADLWPIWPALAAIPTLAVRGGISDLLSPATLAEMKARKPDLQTVEVPRVGHAPFMTEPAAWAALSQFIEGH